MILLIIFGVIFIIVIYWFYFRIHRPEIPPLNIDENDPLMLKAINDSKSNIEEFKNLYSTNPNNAQVKIPFHSSTRQVEFLWGEVKKFENSRLDVFLLTPPVTHDGKLDRNQSYKLEDIIDWAFFMNDGKIKGGYTMKVMFEIARREWGELPDKLKLEEQKYE